ncbi:MAG: DUF5752 family protein [Candidatus Hodarchaeota archaeon]
MVGSDLSDNIVRNAFKKCSPELVFRFYGSNGKVIATISNLSELISTLSEIPPTIAQFHIFRETTKDIFEPRQLNGPVVRSDIALWVNYVLGDIELSKRIYEIGKKEKIAEKLKEEVINLLKEREKELIELSRSS